MQTKRIVFFHTMDVGAAQAKIIREKKDNKSCWSFIHQKCYKIGNIAVCKNGWKGCDLSTHPVTPKMRIKEAPGTEMQTELVNLPSVTTEYNHFFSLFILSSLLKGERETFQTCREGLSHSCSARGKTTTKYTLCNLSTALLPLLLFTWAALLNINCSLGSILKNTQRTYIS